MYCVSASRALTYVEKKKQVPWAIWNLFFLTKSAQSSISTLHLQERKLSKSFSTAEHSSVFVCHNRMQIETLSSVKYSPVKTDFRGRKKTEQPFSTAVQHSSVFACITTECKTTSFPDDYAQSSRYPRGLNFPTGAAPSLKFERNDGGLLRKCETSAIGEVGS